MSFADEYCLVPGCDEPVTHEFSIRMRREDTGADWAPNLPAFFCEDHALEGASISIVYRPNISGQVDVTVTAAISNRARRVVEITRRMGEKKK